MQQFHVTSTETSYMPAFHEQPIFKNQMHKGKTEALSLFACLKSKICRVGRKRSESETAKRYGWGHNRGTSAPSGLVRTSTVTAVSAISTQCLLHSQQHSNSYLILLSTNILLCFWICSTEREAELTGTVHTFFSKQSHMPNQQKALTLFSQVINLNGKPAYCDSITKELLHCGAAGIISISWLKRNQLRLYHNIQSCISPVFTGLPHIT